MTQAGPRPNASRNARGTQGTQPAPGANLGQTTGETQTTAQRRAAGRVRTAAEVRAAQGSRSAQGMRSTQGQYGDPQGARGAQGTRSTQGQRMRGASSGAGPRRSVGTSATGRGVRASAAARGQKRPQVAENSQRIAGVVDSVKSRFAATVGTNAAASRASAGASRGAEDSQPYGPFNVFIGIFFVAVYAVLLVLNIVVPDRATSELENRSLEQFPSEVNEEVFSSLDLYATDQFVGRDSLIHLNYLVKSLCGVSKIDDVYLGSGALIEDAAETNEQQHARNTQAINSFVERHEGVNTSFMLVPDAVSVQAGKLPAFATPLDQNAQIDSFYGNLASSVNKVDVRSALTEHKDKYIFYKSDHHWTSLGAFYGAQAFMGGLNSDDYDTYVVANDFEGTLSNKTGSLGLADTVEIRPPRNLDYVVTFESEGMQSRSIYTSGAFSKRDKYQVFLGGNEGLVRVEANNDSTKHLLLIKDSYANSLLQYLLPYYGSITIVDPRYYYGDVDSLVSSDLITDVLFCYNVNTFVQDTSLADCLGDPAQEETSETQEESADQEEETSETQEESVAQDEEVSETQGEESAVQEE